jgi:hypothetical protein
LGERSGSFQRSARNLHISALSKKYMSTPPVASVATSAASACDHHGGKRTTFLGCRHYVMMAVPGPQPGVRPTMGLRT